MLGGVSARGGLQVERAGRFPSPEALGIRTVREANRHFLSQWGPTAWNSAGAPYGYMDCGPTCAVVSLSARGRWPHVAPHQAEDAIHQMRNLTRGFETQTSGPTHTPMVLRGLRAAGATAWTISRQLGAVDEALERGHVVMLGGDPRFAWGEAAAGRGNYLATFKEVPRFDHWIAVLGKNDLGRYLVADPLSRVGVVPRAPQAIEQFWSDSKYGAAAIEID